MEVFESFEGDDIKEAGIMTMPEDFEVIHGVMHGELKDISICLINTSKIIHLITG